MVIGMLDGIDVFVQVVDSDGFKGAARELGKSTSFVSKKLTRLEASLGVRLLNRTTRSISLTEDGRIYYERCRRIVADAREAAEAVTESLAVPRGVLKVSAPVSFSLGYLAGVLPKFLTRNPGVSLQIELNDRKVDVVAESFDVVLRIGRLEDSSLIARRINTSRGRTVAAPEYWARHGKPAHPRDLSDHVCIGYALQRNPGRWDYVDGNGMEFRIDVQTRVECNSAELECALAVAGLGVTRLPEFACSREIASGLLEPVLDDYASASIGIYAVYPHRNHVSAKIRAFVDFMVAEFGGDLAAPAG